MNETVSFRIGIDVGTNSVGLAAIAVDNAGIPIKILNSVVYVHDSGVDPEQRKYATTRLATAGVARRTRRLYRRRKQRLAKLDAFIREDLGYPIINLEDIPDPHAPWHIRADLATRLFPPEELPEAMSIALRHIARHRGWRSPYARVQSLHQTAPDSDMFTALKNRIMEHNGLVAEEESTPAELISSVLPEMIRIRGAEGILGGKLHQSDYANEIRKICATQGFDTETTNRIIDVVFTSESPKGKAGERAGKDELPGQEKLPRAEKAQPAFQKFRIVATVANLRIADGDSHTERTLSPSELNAVVDFLMEASVDDAVTWGDVAEVLDIDREYLTGTAAVGVDGTQLGAYPPVNVTNQRILSSKNAELMDFWSTASDDEQSALINAISNAQTLSEDDPGASGVLAFLGGLEDQQLEKLLSVSLPAGRAAYSVDSLQRLTNRMLQQGCDLFTARQLEFGVPNDWKPSAEPIGAPVGNPGVDRVLKIVNRWLLGIERRYGIPESINIEHIRGAFGSERMAREYAKENHNRHKRNQAVVSQIYAENAIQGSVRRSDIIRYLAVKRQNSQCAYCGTTITLATAEMDHIVPRKGQGSTNTRNNLLAACRQCNHSKGNLPFAIWAAQQQNPDVSFEKAKERIHHWVREEGYTAKQWANFKKDVVLRLMKKSFDDEIDSRSIESVAWMARELHHRIEYHFKAKNPGIEVGVFQGRITAEARKASGFENQVRMIGGGGKSRLDRRHHAMDACVIAMMSSRVATILAQRVSMRDAQRLERRHETWKDFYGATDAAREAMSSWNTAMGSLVSLFNNALDSNSIPVMENLRLRLGSGKAHDDRIRELSHKRIGSAWTIEEIDRASTPQLWKALTTLPDFDETSGLPENQQRRIRIKGTWYNAKECVGIFNTGAAALAVRGGYAEIGNTIHHARIYRINGKKQSYAMIRVFAVDLLPHRDEDLFSVALPPESISMRTTAPKLRQALKDGTAEYLGWLVAGDEIQIDPSASVFQTKSIGVLLKEFPDTHSFRVDGIPEPARLRLRPTILAGEGLSDNAPKEVKDILNGNGWLPAVNVVFGSGMPSVIRRNSLGEPRKRSNSGMPVSWQV